MLIPCSIGAGKLIWGMLLCGLLFGLTSMLGLDMWLVYNKPRCETRGHLCHSCVETLSLLPYAC